AARLHEVPTLRPGGGRGRKLSCGAGPRSVTTGTRGPGAGRRRTRDRPRGPTMSPSLPLIVATLASPIVALPAQVWQVAPDNPGPPWLITRTNRAVLLVHGLRIHPLHPDRAARPGRHEWQEPRCELVRALAADADVFAFSYAQTTPLDAVAHSAILREAVDHLRT